jgi:hypothetical protein
MIKHFIFATLAVIKVVYEAIKGVLYESLKGDYE